MGLEQTWSHWICMTSSTVFLRTLVDLLWLDLTRIHLYSSSSNYIQLQLLQTWSTRSTPPTHLLCRSAWEELLLLPLVFPPQQGQIFQLSKIWPLFCVIFMLKHPSRGSSFCWNSCRFHHCNVYFAWPYQCKTDFWEGNFIKIRSLF